MTQKEIISDFPLLEPKDIGAALLFASVRMNKPALFTQPAVVFWLDGPIAVNTGELDF